jgi:hypothetical protein
MRLAAGRGLFAGFSLSARVGTVTFSGPTLKPGMTETSCVPIPPFLGGYNG